MVRPLRVLARELRFRDLDRLQKAPRLAEHFFV
jgi:hypothetical protein